MYCFDISDGVIVCLAAECIFVERCLGGYGVSTFAFDVFVDVVFGAGVYGVCLTGVGLAGLVFVLCSAMEALCIVERFWQIVVFLEFVLLVGVFESFLEVWICDSVVINYVVVGVGEFLFYSVFR